MRTLMIDTVPSTNSWVAENAARLERPCLVYAIEQTAGRGQRGNSWEAESGMNLTASALLDPQGIAPERQFVISEAVALAVTDMLSELGVDCLVKWPNDIYAGDRKICGILIENAIMGRLITRTIAGIGVNINQMEFRSDAPNPVSVRQLTGEENPIDGVAGLLASKLEVRIRDAETCPEAVHREFMELLWRGDGRLYPFFDRKARERILASIAAIDPDGTLTLMTESGERRRYVFKEVEFVLG